MPILCRHCLTEISELNYNCLVRECGTISMSVGEDGNICEDDQEASSSGDTADYSYECPDCGTETHPNELLVFTDDGDPCNPNTRSWIMNRLEDYRNIFDHEPDLRPPQPPARNGLPVFVWLSRVANWARQWGIDYHITGGNQLILDSNVVELRPPANGNATHITEQAATPNPPPPDNTHAVNPHQELYQAHRIAQFQHNGQQLKQCTRCGRIYDLSTERTTDLECLCGEIINANTPSL